MRAGKTCWTLIRGAAEGNASDRDRFAALYLPVVRGYLSARWSARWRGRGAVAELEDAVQQVFVECLRKGGVLERAAVSVEGSFRSFLSVSYTHLTLPTIYSV